MPTYLHIYIYIYIHIMSICTYIEVSVCGRMCNPQGHPGPAPGYDRHINELATLCRLARAHRGQRTCVYLHIYIDTCTDIYVYIGTYVYTYMHIYIEREVCVHKHTAYFYVARSPSRYS